MASDETHRTPDDVLALNVRAYRNLGRLKQDDVANRMASLGHTWWRATVSEVERGHRRVSVSELFSLAMVLGVRIAELIDPAGPDGSNTTRVVLGDPGGRERRTANPGYRKPFRMAVDAARLIAWSRKRIPWDADPSGEGPGGPGFVGYTREDLVWLGRREDTNEGDDQ